MDALWQQAGEVIVAPADRRLEFIGVLAKDPAE